MQRETWTLTLANRNVMDFGWEIAHAAVSRRPQVSHYTVLYCSAYSHVHVGSLVGVCPESASDSGAIASAVAIYL